MYNGHKNILSRLSLLVLLRGLQEIWRISTFLSLAGLLEDGHSGM